MIDSIEALENSDPLMYINAKADSGQMDADLEFYKDMLNTFKGELAQSFLMKRAGQENTNAADELVAIHNLIPEMEK